MKSLSIAIVGGESLAGKEVREVFRQRELAWTLHLIGADEAETGKFTEEGEELAVITALDASNLAGADAVVLAGSAVSSRRAHEILVDASPGMPLIDLTRTLEDVATARLCAPTAGLASSGYPAVVAHPAAIALAEFHNLLRGPFPLKHWLAEVFEPASERGQAGIDELHQQTVKLFSFQAMPKEVYDTQLAYSLLAAYGEESPYSLDAVEQMIERHLASLFGANGAMPSLRLIQAPVFHGYMISAWVEFAESTTVEALQLHLRTEGVDVRGADEEPPSNPSVPGQDGLIIGNIRPDRNHRNAFWFWIGVDNLRLPAVNAARVVEAVCG
ncbi:MAG: hypothetical protein HY820_33475 [Acidobacteria bacterium]|nr:hypothetical protein [Acidobacteriota bacterium]